MLTRHGSTPCQPKPRYNFCSSVNSDGDWYGGLPLRRCSLQENSTGEITMPRVRQSRRPKKKQRTVVSPEVVEIQRFDDVNDNVSYLADRMELVEEEENFKDDSVAQK